MASNINESASWYLRKRGQIFGPYTSKQLSQLRDRGQISRYHELSPDKSVWQTAEGIGLFAPQPSLEVEPAAGQTAPNTQVPVNTSSAIEVSTDVPQRSLRLSLGIITIGYALELTTWIIVGFIWLLGFLGENAQLFDVAGIIILCSVVVVNILLIVGYGIGCGARHHELSSVRPIACLMLQIIDFLCVVFAIMLAVIAFIPVRHWPDLFTFNTGILVINGLRFVLAVAASVFLVEWLRSIGHWLSKTGTSNSVNYMFLLNPFYLAYGFQIFLTLVLTLLVFSFRSRVDHELRAIVNDQKMAIIFFVLLIVNIVFIAITSIWRVVLLSMAAKSNVRPSF